MTQALKSARPVAASQEEEVLSKAVARIADFWKLTNSQLGNIIGVSPATASRLRAGSWRLERQSKPFELSQYLLRLFRSLDSLAGSDDQSAISWLRAQNSDLGQRPIDLILSIKGLMQVCNYVDAFRARV